jgi:rhodanese-related sulfurtransferase
MSPAFFLVTLLLGLGLVILYWSRQKKSERQLEEHSITPEALHSLISSGKKVLLFDVRQPLDLLTNTEMIPGAKRVPPKDVIANPSLLPKDQEAVVYCTCPSDKTSRTILRHALDLGFKRIKFLQGGLGAWKAQGYPVAPYKESFHLDTVR